MVPLHRGEHHDAGTPRQLYRAPRDGDSSPHRPLAPEMVQYQLPRGCDTRSQHSGPQLGNDHSRVMGA
jgi:hypothetical protein